MSDFPLSSCQLVSSRTSASEAAAPVIVDVASWAVGPAPFPAPSPGPNLGLDCVCEFELV